MARERVSTRCGRPPRLREHARRTDRQGVERARLVDDLEAAFPDIPREHLVRVAQWLLQHPPRRMRAALDFQREWSGRVACVEPSERLSAAVRELLDDEVLLRVAIASFQEAANAWCRSVGLPTSKLPRFDIARIAVARARRRCSRWARRLLPFLRSTTDRDPLNDNEAKDT